jgi:UDP-N-acetylmuramate--alanine ligase
VYDDYSHHPVEVTATLKGLKEMSQGRLRTVFQPHLFTRTRDFYNEFAQALAISDEVLLMDIYPAREKPIEGITSELILNEALNHNKNMKLVHEKKDIIAWLKNDLNPGDVIVFQGAGDITNLCNEFVNLLKNSN